MRLETFQTPKDLGQAAAKFCETVINRAIAEKGSARIVLSTGASQFDTFAHLVKADVDWSCVDMFHLDEYIDLPESHPASFRRYLNEKFISQVHLRNAYLVDGEGDVQAKLEALSAKLLEVPVDLALIGIGENAHVAFNDPPADFDTQEPYIIVDLDEVCKNQQVREGWFASLADVPKSAVTMSVHRVMQSKVILSCVPYQVKAEAVKRTLTDEVTNMVPATILKTHPDWHLYLDTDSASLLDKPSIV